MSSVEAKRTRRPAARQRDVVIAAAEERLLMLEAASSLEYVTVHASRLRELFEELRRAIGKDEE